MFKETLNFGCLAFAAVFSPFPSLDPVVRCFEQDLSLPAERREGELCFFGASLLLLRCITGYLVVLHNIVYRVHIKTQHVCAADYVGWEWSQLC